MPDESSANTIASEGRRGSIEAGDVPESLRRRYYVDGRGGPGLGFYVDARIKTAAFRDRGAQLVAARNNPNAVRDMTAIAHHRGWTSVVVRGDAEFRREAWLAAMTLGIEVRGHRPTARDQQELDRRHASRARDDARPRGEPKDAAAAVRGNMRVIETVVRARVGDLSAQERILAAARERMAGWLERGARLNSVVIPRDLGPGRTTERLRERQRGR
jgi:hypothetical protein